MRNVFKSILKKKSSNVLLIIQIMISLIFFFLAYVEYKQSFGVFHSVPEEVKPITNDILSLEVQTDDNQEKEIHEFFLKLKKAGVVKNFSGYHNTWIQSNVFGSEDLSMLSFENDMQWLRELKIESGRNFQSEDFDQKQYNGSKNHPFPVLLGAQLNQKYEMKMGDVFSDVNGRYYKVIGILEKESFWFMDVISEGNMISLDNQVVSAMTDQDKVFMHYWCQAIQKDDTARLKKQVENMASEENITVKMEVLGDVMEKEFQESWNENIIWLSFSVIVLVMISFATATLMGARIYSRKKEIGVRMAVGFSSKKIAWQLSIEFLVLSLIALFLASAICFTLLGDNSMTLDGASTVLTKKSFSMHMVFLGFGIILLQCLPSSLVAVHKLGMIQPKNLIGGKE